MFGFCGRLALLATCVATMTCQQVKDLPEGVLLIRNGILIDGSGASPIPGALVAIWGDRIVGVGRESAFRIRNTSRIIDAQGGTILPGFIDSHSHLLSGSKDLDADLRLWLKAGITTLRDLGSHYGKSGDISELRRRISRLGNTVPTIVLAGSYLTATGGHPVEGPIKWGPEVALEVADVEQARQSASFLLDAGADGLKIAVESGTPQGSMPTLTGDQIAAITAVAHARGTWVSAHITHAHDAELAVAHGVDDLAHPPVERLPESLMQKMLEHNVFLGTTFVAQDTELLPLLGFNETRISGLRAVRHEYFRRFIDAGGSVVLGSDYPFARLGKGMPTKEMEQMLAVGLSSMEVIVAATRNAARACGLGEEVGVLESGKRADVIVVRGDPLTDIRALEQIQVVIKSGEVVLNRWPVEETLR